MDSMEQRLKALEEKVKVLEETLDTLKNMQLSEQMESYIQNKTKSLKMIGLVNAMSDKPSLDFSKEEESLNNVRKAKRTVDIQIQTALKNVGTFSDAFPDDPRYFNYEIESGEVIDSFWKRKTKVNELAKFVGKGLRITAYNGFETDRVIIPNEIDGKPVISIGEKAFMNATISEVIFPKSIKTILDSAFDGCKNLKNIDLPNTLAYLGSGCFSGSGLEKFNCPNSLQVIPDCCFYRCEELRKVNLGHQVKEIALLAFSNCFNLCNIVLPESLLELGKKCFESTKITTMIFPSNVQKVSNEMFGDNITRNPTNITCVFLGKDTTVDAGSYSYETLRYVSLIYCLPGSNIQQFAREKSIPMKPLSEFRMEEYV